MIPRIETAEVLSFRLKVPPQELERLPAELGAELGLCLEPDDGELLLCREEADSYLRFRPIGAEAMLTEIFLCNDERGVFFHRVLGALMVRHGGDLRIRLSWNTPERNSHGDYAEVRISRGATTYPGLADGLPAVPPAGEGGAQVAVQGDESLEGAAPSLEKEVEEVLSRARAHWEEYLRLKSARERKD
ncbi:MAG: hypothetical protein HYZ28_16150 [Myxococcales bacterium]|nr:hypothetical protein [Myxococcales bacterium]